ncbi:MAG: hypothetical protein ABSD62_08670 [Candidatus Limnocylindrales bacterium]|jgi:hypothetical protein
MAETRPPKGKMRSLTVAALLGVFVAAVVLAIVSRLVPGRLSRLVRKPGGTDRP